jgi:hypothetical protein
VPDHGEHAECRSLRVDTPVVHGAQSGDGNLQINVFAQAASDSVVQARGSGTALAWRCAQDFDPLQLGVHAAEQVDGMPVLPAYVERDQDSALVEALEDAAAVGGLVVVEGPSGAGKTRSAARSLHQVLAGRLLAAPDTTPELCAAAVTAQASTPGRVIWLDDVDRFLGPEGLTPSLLTRLADNAVVIVATLRTDRALMFTESETATDSAVMAGSALPGAELAARVLERATTVHLDRRWTESEILCAQAIDDDRLERAVRHAEEYGIAEYLSAGPRILAAYERAKEPGCRPRAAALIAAAVDLTRAGLVGPLPARLIVTVHQHYLDEWGGARLRPEHLDQALAWAATPRGAASPLLQSADGSGYVPFDYLVEAVHDTGTPIPRIVWNKGSPDCSVGMISWFGRAGRGGSRRGRAWPGR